MSVRDIAVRMAIVKGLADPFNNEMTDLLEEAVKAGYKIGLEDGKVLGAQK